MAKKASITLIPANAAAGSRVILEPPGYLGVAGRLLAEARAIHAAMQQPPMDTLAMTCAHATECALKEYLTRDGDDDRVTGWEVRHNIKRLWAMAAEDGLRIDPTPPGWAVCLSHLHDRPFDLRYGARFCLMVYPPFDQVIVGLTDLLDQVRRQITESRRATPADRPAGQ